MTPHDYALLFDLDGTLIDSAADLQTAVNAILAQEGLSPLGRNDIETCLGDGLRLMLAKAFALRCHALEEDDLQKLMPRFEAIYSSITPDAACIYPGVAAFLRAMQKRGVKLGLCTNKYTVATLRILKQLELAAYFDVIVCGDTVSACKPHAAPLLHALERLNVPAKNALMLGDHANDVLSARGAGMKVIGAQYGYSRTWPAEAQPDAFVKSFAEYEALLPNVLNGF